MLDLILQYVTDGSVSVFERLLAVFLPVVCLSVSGYLVLSFTGRKLAENPKGGIIRFFAFCAVSLSASAVLLVPWIAYVYLATKIALHP